MTSHQENQDAAATTPVDSLRAEKAAPSVEAIVKELEAVIDHLSPIASAKNVAQWRASLKAVEEEAAKSPEVVIAFVGMTGAGKSSLINALLGDHIVPTSGVKSCTSTPIKISYHDSDRVSATVEFVSAESWLEEIRHCISAFIEADGKLTKLDDGSKEAWDRIRVVYPNLTAAKLQKSTAEDVLASDGELRVQLGTTWAIDAPPGGFRGALQHFAALWPVIAQVSVRCAAPVLARGVALVDLPGVLDANAARAAIARDYLKLCDRVFVVAPIKRVATDQVARDLMGEAFKSQLMMDGKYSTSFVAVIATCIDDISCSDSVEEFKLDYVPDWTIPASKRERLIQDLNLVLSELAAPRVDRDGMHRADTSLSALPTTPTSPQTNQATAVSHPSVKGIEANKRAAEDTASPPKRQKLGVRFTDTIGGFAPWLAQSQPPGDVAPAAGATDHLSVTTQGGRPVDIVAQKCRVFALQSAIRDAEKECMRVCIERRNSWARNELQEQFLEGREARFNGDEVNNDNEEEEDANLTVFPVSARDYLKLQDRSPLDGNATTICETAEETGIPAVIEFCRQIGLEALLNVQSRRAAQLSGILAQLEYLVTAHKCGTEVSSLQLSAGTTSSEDLYVDVLCHITTGIRKIAESTAAKVLRDLNAVLIAQMKVAPGKAAKDVSSHIRQSSKAVTHYRTLKAILRRDGAWKQHDWNAEAIYCLCESFARTWSRVLAVHLLKDDVKSVCACIESAFGMIEASTPAGLQSLFAKQKPKVLAQVDAFARQAAYKCKTTIRNHQAGISRQMQVKMTMQMHGVYQRAHALSGIGVMVQALRLICEGLDEHATQMFTSVIEETVDALQTTMGEALHDYTESLSEIAALVEGNLPPSAMLQGKSIDDASQGRLDEVVPKLTDRKSVV